MALGVRKRRRRNATYHAYGEAFFTHPDEHILLSIDTYERHPASARGVLCLESKPNHRLNFSNYASDPHRLVYSTRSSGTPSVRRRCHRGALAGASLSPAAAAAAVLLGTVRCGTVGFQTRGGDATEVRTKLLWKSSPERQIKTQPLFATLQSAPSMPRDPKPSGYWISHHHPKSYKSDSPKAPYGHYTF